VKIHRGAEHEEVVFVTIKDKRDEEKAARLAVDKWVVVTTTDWTVIPLENLIAQRSRVIARVTSAAEARLARARDSAAASRAELGRAIGSGAVSPAYARLKVQVRDDLNAVRRARRALKRAAERSDQKAAAAARKGLDSAKTRLKKNRTEMRRLLHRTAAKDE